MNQDESKQVEMGIAAASLLENPFFVHVMAEMGNAYVNGIVSTQTDDTKAREGFYHSIKALQDINATLAHWVQVKEQIVLSQINTEETE